MVFLAGDFFLVTLFFVLVFGLLFVVVFLSVEFFVVSLFFVFVFHLNICHIVTFMNIFMYIFNSFEWGNVFYIDMALIF